MSIGRAMVIGGFVLAGLGGCGGSATDDDPDPAIQARAAAARDAATIRITPAELRRKLNANELALFTVSGNDIVEASLIRSGVKSIEPLRGLPLRGLDLGFTDVSDLSPLDGMKLTTLVLENTQVADISVLKGMPLKTLKLQNTKVTDLSVLAGMPLTELNLYNVPFSDLSLLNGMPLKTLWLRGTKVTDLAGLEAHKLVSLDLEDTSVASLEPLSQMTSLKRLSIARTGVTDVSPLKDLALERIVLSPEKITTGMDVLRSMKSLVQIQLAVEENQSAAEFWKRYDVGAWKPLDATPAESATSTTPATPTTPESSGATPP